MNVKNVFIIKSISEIYGNQVIISVNFNKVGRIDPIILRL